MNVWVKQKGFTIVELLIVVVVIAILAAITIVAYNGVQKRAYTSKIQTDYVQLQKAIMGAREATGKTLFQLTNNSYTAGQCRSSTIPDGTDLKSLPSTNVCWTTYNQTLGTISDASGVNVRGMLDPWGWPYAIDENEGENGGCNRDQVYVFARPLNSYAAGPYDTYPVTDPNYPFLNVPRTGFTGCQAD